MSTNTKKTCAVGGIIKSGNRVAACGHVIVGGKFCGYPGFCDHQTDNGASCKVVAAVQMEKERNGL